MLVAAVIYDRFVLLLVSPALSLFFGLMALALLGMILNSLLRINEIADKLNQIIGETVMKWESSGWVPNLLKKDRFLLIYFSASSFSFEIKSLVGSSDNDLS
jgi:hypothetical protein